MGLAEYVPPVHRAKFTRVDVRARQIAHVLSNQNLLVPVHMAWANLISVLLQQLWTASRARATTFGLGNRALRGPANVMATLSMNWKIQHPPKTEYVRPKNVLARVVLRQRGLRVRILKRVVPRVPLEPTKQTVRVLLVLLGKRNRLPVSPLSALHVVLAKLHSMHWMLVQLVLLVNFKPKPCTPPTVANFVLLGNPLVVQAYLHVNVHVRQELNSRTI